MTDATTQARELGEQFLKSLDKAHVGAAASKLFSASIGEIVTIFSRSPAHKHYSLADIEWMVVPAIFSRQFYVVEAAHREHGFRAPIAAVTWAFVSEEVDRRLEEQTARPVRMRPDEWTSGEIGWLIDAVGSPAGVDAALQWVKAGPFKGRSLKLLRDVEGGKAKIALLDDVAASAAAKGQEQ
jgi:hemolysin-activating ACP:hemolysin acyltransferase